ncbi:MAG: hypothetical protein ABIT20_04170 [Gemmatimonadaceae bacterium]
MVEALQLDLVGPSSSHALADERLKGWERPATQYLTGFLIPSRTPAEKAADADESDELESIPESAGLSEESTEERKAAKKGHFPSSMGLSFLVPPEARSVEITACWGDYATTELEDGDGKRVSVWQGQLRDETVTVTLTDTSRTAPYPVPNSGGLELFVVERPLVGDTLGTHFADGTRSVSAFLVNKRAPVEENRDTAYALQAQLVVRCDAPFVPRPDPRGAVAEEWDELVADLYYADAPEYATGHGVSAEWETVDECCSVIRTAWIPSAEVEKTTTVDPQGAELSMELLGALADGASVEPALQPIVSEYRALRRSPPIESRAASRLCEMPPTRSTRFVSQIAPWRSRCGNVAKHRAFPSAYQPGAHFSSRSSCSTFPASRIRRQESRDSRSALLSHWWR